MNIIFESIWNNIYPSIVGGILWSITKLKTYISDKKIEKK